MHQHGEVLFPMQVHFQLRSQIYLYYLIGSCVPSFGCCPEDFFSDAAPNKQARARSMPSEAHTNSAE